MLSTKKLKKLDTQSEPAKTDQTVDEKSEKTSKRKRLLKYINKIRKQYVNTNGTPVEASEIVVIDLEMENDVEEMEITSMQPDQDLLIKFVSFKLRDKQLTRLIKNLTNTFASSNNTSELLKENLGCFVELYAYCSSLNK